MTILSRDQQGGAVMSFRQEQQSVNRAPKGFADRFAFGFNTQSIAGTLPQVHS
jgi:hypothetical protein